MRKAQLTLLLYWTTEVGVWRAWPGSWVHGGRALVCIEIKLMCVVVFVCQRSMRTCKIPCFTALGWKWSARIGLETVLEDLLVQVATSPVPSLLVFETVSVK